MQVPDAAEIQPAAVAGLGAEIQPDADQFKIQLVAVAREKVAAAKSAAQEADVTQMNVTRVNKDRKSAARAKAAKALVDAEIAAWVAKAACAMAGLVSNLCVFANRLYVHGCSY